MAERTERRRSSSRRERRARPAPSSAEALDDEPPQQRSSNPTSMPTPPAEHTTRFWLMDFFCPPPPTPIESEPSAVNVGDKTIDAMEGRLADLESMVLAAKAEAREEAWKRHLAEQRAELMMKMARNLSVSGEIPASAAKKDVSDETKERAGSSDDERRLPLP